jgi:hypothetical protein
VVIPIPLGYNQKNRELENKKVIAVARIHLKSWIDFYHYGKSIRKTSDWVLEFMERYDFTLVVAEKEINTTVHFMNQ